MPRGWVSGEEQEERGEQFCNINVIYMVPQLKGTSRDVHISTKEAAQLSFTQHF